MTPPSAFSAYTLTQVDTGCAFYTTTATKEEIHAANYNLKAAGENFRFYPAGTYTSPSLHGDG